MTSPLNQQNASLLPISQVFSKDYDQFLLQITKIYSDVSRAINTRDIALYAVTEQQDGQQWFIPGNPQSYRDGFRKVVPFPAPLVGGLNTIAHGIPSVTTTFFFTRIWGTGKNAAGTLWVPFPQGGANTSQLEVDITNVNLTVPAAYAGFSAVVVLEYLKN